MTAMEYVFFVLAMAIVTFVPRYLPLYFANRLVLPRIVEQALNYVPIAILTIIIVQTVVYQDRALDLSWTNPYIGASLVAFVFALTQKKLFITIGAGLLSYGILKFWLLA